MKPQTQCQLVAERISHILGSRLQFTNKEIGCQMSILPLKKKKKKRKPNKKTPKRKKKKKKKTSSKIAITKTSQNKLWV